MDAEIKKAIDDLLQGQKLDGDVLGALPCPAMLVNEERVIQSANSAALEFGVEVGSYCWDTFGKCTSIPETDKKYFEEHGRAPEGGTSCIFCQANQVLQSGKTGNIQIGTAEARWDTYWIPVENDTYLHFAIKSTDDQD